MSPCFRVSFDFDTIDCLNINSIRAHNSCALKTSNSYLIFIKNESNLHYKTLNYCYNVIRFEKIFSWQYFRYNSYSLFIILTFKYKFSIYTVCVVIFNRSWTTTLMQNGTFNEKNFECCQEDLWNKQIVQYKNKTRKSSLLQHS